MHSGTFLRSVLIAFTATCASVAVHAQTVWTMVSGYPESSYFTQNIREFIKEIESKSAGKLKIDLRSNDTLIKLDAIKRAVQSGQVQIGEIRLSVYGNEGAMYNLDNIPGVAVDIRQVKKLEEAQRPFYEESFKKNGMRIVSMTPWPGQGFFTKQPIKSLADLKGQKLRIYSKQTQQLGEQLSMDALILPFAEVPQAFSTGMIQALWTSAQTGVDAKVWENVKYFAYTGTMQPKNAIVINERAFRQLDSNTQKIVLEAGAAATQRGFEMCTKANADREQTLKEHGIVITEMPQDVLAKIEVIGKGMISEWLANAKPEERAVYEAYRQSLK